MINTSSEIETTSEIPSYIRVARWLGSKDRNSVGRMWEKSEALECCFKWGKPVDDHFESSLEFPQNGLENED